MCGITAYCGKGQALPFLIQGLKKLEYRGYDSAGVSVVDGGKKVRTLKAKGRLKNLEALLEHDEMKGHVGIGHTRWATHGVPSDKNAHPHYNTDETISIVHNGIIENYAKLKNFLKEKDYVFKTDTDSEVIAQLLSYYFEGDMHEALLKVIDVIEGSYALCVVSSLAPNRVDIAKKDSPLVIGKIEDGSVAASDVPALLDYTKNVYFLDDGDTAILLEDDIKFFDKDNNPIKKEMVKIPYDNEQAQKGGYDSFMMKEIYEQPYAISETLRGRIENREKVMLEELEPLKDQFSKFNKAYFVACGTAHHSCLTGANIFEKFTKIPVLIPVASEFRYNDPIIDDKTLVVFVSQSGETADTMAALRLAKEKGATTIGVVNVLGSSLSRNADYTIYTTAGPEIAVASTKAYTTQLVVLQLMAVYIAQSLGYENSEYKKIIDGLYKMPQMIEDILKDVDIFEKYASFMKDKHDCIYIGRGLDYGTVMEGALKIKEVSYIHADAYYAGELKHGPIALVEDGSIVVAVATSPITAAKTISNIQETVARGAKVILFTTESKDPHDIENVYYLPEIDPVLQTILTAVPLQLMAYFTAVAKGCDVDKPRNLAKSVTVE